MKKTIRKKIEAARSNIKAPHRQIRHERNWASRRNSRELERQSDFQYEVIGIITFYFESIRRTTSFRWLSQWLTLTLLFSLVRSRRRREKLNWRPRGLTTVSDGYRPEKR
jgi:hypothetical protein